MNPRLKKLLLGIQVFTLACNKANANTKGLVYLQDGALVKPYLGLGDSRTTLLRRLGLPICEYPALLPPEQPILRRQGSRFRARLAPVG